MIHPIHPPPPSAQLSPARLPGNQASRHYSVRASSSTIHSHLYQHSLRTWSLTHPHPQPPPTTQATLMAPQELIDKLKNLGISERSARYALSVSHGLPSSTSAPPAETAEQHSIVPQHQCTPSSQLQLQLRPERTCSALALALDRDCSEGDVGAAFCADWPTRQAVPGLCATFPSLQACSAR